MDLLKFVQDEFVTKNEFLNLAQEMLSQYITR